MNCFTVCGYLVAPEFYRPIALRNSACRRANPMMLRLVNASDHRANAGGPSDLAPWSIQRIFWDNNICADCTGEHYQRTCCVGGGTYEKLKKYCPTAGFFFAGDGVTRSG